MLPPFRFLFVVLLVLWAGLVLGVSFLATPVKFTAAHLTMPVALEIGVATFGLFNMVEWCMLGLVFVVAIIQRTSQAAGIAIALGLLLSAQTFWLLPVLHVRAEVVISGGLANPGMHHWIYIIVDSAKLIALATGVWLTGGRSA